MCGLYPIVSGVCGEKQAACITPNKNEKAATSPNFIGCSLFPFIKLIKAETFCLIINFHAVHYSDSLFFLCLCESAARIMQRSLEKGPVGG